MLLRDKVKAMPGSKYMQTKDAGELEKIDFQHIPIIIEQPVGSIREGTKPDGTHWQTKFLYPYGYIEGTQGADSDGIDVFIGPNAEADKVFTIKQVQGNRFDEDKVMLGFDTEEAARDAYLAHYNTQEHLGIIIIEPVEEFREKMNYYVFLGENQKDT